MVEFWLWETLLSGDSNVVRDGIGQQCEVSWALGAYVADDAKFVTLLGIHSEVILGAGACCGSRVVFRASVRSPKRRWLRAHGRVLALGEPSEW